MKANSLLGAGEASIVAVTVVLGFYRETQKPDLDAGRSHLVGSVFASPSEPKSWTRLLQMVDSGEILFAEDGLKVPARGRTQAAPKRHDDHGPRHYASAAPLVAREWRGVPFWRLVRFTSGSAESSLRTRRGRGARRRVRSRGKAPWQARKCFRCRHCSPQSKTKPRAVGSGFVPVWSGQRIIPPVDAGRVTEAILETRSREPPT